MILARFLNYVVHTHTSLVFKPFAFMFHGFPMCDTYIPKVTRAGTGLGSGTEIIYVYLEHTPV